MGCDYYIWDNEEERFIGTQFASFEGAESWIEKNGDFDRYDIFEKLT